MFYILYKAVHLLNKEHAYLGHTKAKMKCVLSTVKSSALKKKKVVPWRECLKKRDGLRSHTPLKHFRRGNRNINYINSSINVLL